MSNGDALRPAERALFGVHRPAMGRFMWMLASEHDERVSSFLGWVQHYAWGLTTIGVRILLSFFSFKLLFSSFFNA